MIITKIEINGRSRCVMLFLIYLGCSSNDEPEPGDCTTSDLAITLGTKSDPTSCSTNNGSISVSASGGSTPYQYKVNSAVYGSASTFVDLSSGTYTILVKDNNGCERAFWHNS
ncbi:MAG: SprB repeat-containing protein [Cytophagales bacterium]|nr:SprB repeat-containing protein [Cytophagales bacterium]